MTAANISKWKFRIGNAASPEVFTAIEEVYSISGVGKTNELVEVTNFDSPVGTKEFIPGLAEGSEVTIEANYIPAATQQAALIAVVDSGTNTNFQVAYTGSSPEETFNFTASPLTWEIVPSPTERNSIRFVVKISGAIS